MRSLSLALCMMMVASVARAQQDAESARPADDCYTTLRTGSGSTYTKVCISSTGNITSYESPLGVEHIRVLDPIEGFRICRHDDWAPSYDSGVAEYALGDEAATIYQPNGRNTLPLRITRTDEVVDLRVVQQFFFNAHRYGPAELKIEMKVYNVGTATIPGVVVQRFFDGDINGTLSNEAAVTNSAVLLMIPPPEGRVSPSSRGLSLSAGILDKPHWANQVSYNTLVWYGESGESSECTAGDPEWADPQDSSDKAGVVTYSVGDILPGRVKTVSFIYRRF